MKLKLVINGSDMRVRITPETSADKKLLEFVAQMDIGRIKTARKQEIYSDSEKQIQSIDLELETTPVEGSAKEVDYPSV